MTITNWALIDHIGSVDSEDISKLYNTAYKDAQKHNFERIYRIKELALKINPNAPLKAMQNSIRFNKHPKTVYIICDDFTSYIKWYADNYKERDITVNIVASTDFFEYTGEIAQVVYEMDRKRRCASIWSKALGWQFSAPILREPGTEDVDTFSKRPNRELLKDNKKDIYLQIEETKASNSPDKYNKLKNLYRLLDMAKKEELSISQAENTTESGSYGAKRTTRPEKFVNSKRAVATDAEIDQFFQHYKFLQQNGLLAESLECDYTLCPTCGRPHYISEESCPWCNTEFEPIEITRYFEEDDYDDYDYN